MNPPTTDRSDFACLVCAHDRRDHGRTGALCHCGCTTFGISFGLGGAYAAFTVEERRFAAGIVQEAICAWDGDGDLSTAGRRAIERAIELVYHRRKGGGDSPG